MRKQLKAKPVFFAPKRNEKRSNESEAVWNFLFNSPSSSKFFILLSAQWAQTKFYSAFFLCKNAKVLNEFARFKEEKNIRWDLVRVFFFRVIFTKLSFFSRTLSYKAVKDDDQGQWKKHHKRFFFFFVNLDVGDEILSTIINFLLTFLSFFSLLCILFHGSQTEFLIHSLSYTTCTSINFFTILFFCAIFYSMWEKKLKLYLLKLLL